MDFLANLNCKKSPCFGGMALNTARKFDQTNMYEIMTVYIEPSHVKVEISKPNSVYCFVDASRLKQQPSPTK